MAQVTTLSPGLQVTNSIFDFGDRLLFITWGIAMVDIGYFLYHTQPKDHVMKASTYELDFPTRLNMNMFNLILNNVCIYIYSKYISNSPKVLVRFDFLVEWVLSIIVLKVQLALRPGMEMVLRCPGCLKCPESLEGKRTLAGKEYGILACPPYE